jgi:Uma2 family endonuclease
MTALLQTPSRAEAFTPGTSGWTADDLNDPSIEQIWELARYEIIEGVLATMAPAFFDGSSALDELVHILMTHLRARGEAWKSAHEPDLVLSTMRVVKPDVVFLSPKDLARQRAENGKRGKKQLVYGRVLLPPTLVIESISLGHEVHDEEIKRRWYAEAGVPNYWLLNAYAKTLQCLILRDGTYRLDAAGKGTAKVKPAAFSGLVIPLKTLWA